MNFPGSPRSSLQPIERRHETMGSRLLRPLLCALIGAFACGGLPPDPPAARVDVQQQSIIGGVPETGFQAVVSLFGCTGVVVSPHVVLTAGHCVGDGEVPVSFDDGTQITG